MCSCLLDRCPLFFSFPSWSREGPNFVAKFSEFLAFLILKPVFPPTRDFDIRSFSGWREALVVCPTLPIRHCLALISWARTGPDFENSVWDCTDFPDFSMQMTKFRENAIIRRKNERAYARGSVVKQLSAQLGEFEYNWLSERNFETRKFQNFL